MLTRLRGRWQFSRNQWTLRKTRILWRCHTKESSVSNAAWYVEAACDCFMTRSWLWLSFLDQSEYSRSKSEFDFWFVIFVKVPLEVEIFTLLCRHQLLLILFRLLWKFNGNLSHNLVFSFQIESVWLSQGSLPGCKDRHQRTGGIKQSLDKVTEKDCHWNCIAFCFDNDLKIFLQ